MLLKKKVSLFLGVLLFGVAKAQVCNKICKCILNPILWSPPPPTTNCSVLLSLRSSQIDIDAEDEDGWTALHAAVYWGNMGVAEELNIERS